MNRAVKIAMLIPPEARAVLAIRAAESNVTTDEIVRRIVVRAIGAEGKEEPPPAPPVTLDIAPILTPEERRRLDGLALRHGASREALTAATVRRLLQRAQAKPQTFRLKMPEQAKRKLEDHAQALGCGAGELAAFLFSRRDSRPQATLAGG